MPIDTPRAIARFLDTVGDGSGSSDGAGNRLANAVVVANGTVSFDEATKTISLDTGSWTLTPLAGNTVTVADSTSNNGSFTVASATANTIVVEEDLVDETSTANVDVNEDRSRRLILAPGPTDVFVLTTILHAALGIGISAITATGFGASAGGLTVGLKLEVQDAAGAVLLDLLDGQTIKFNHDWLLHGMHKPGTNVMTVVRGISALLHLPDMLGAALRLRGDRGERLVATVADNFTAFAEVQRFKALGVRA